MRPANIIIHHVYNAGPDELEYTIWHVFLPADTLTSTIPTHPVKGSKSLARTACATARTHTEFVDDALKPQWHRIIRMLDNLQACFQPASGCLALNDVVSRLCGMETGDVLVFLNRVEDSAAVFTKQGADYTLYRPFQVPLSVDYSGRTTAIANEVLRNKYFATELANFLLLEGCSCVAPVQIGEILTNILEGIGWKIETPSVTEPIQSHYKRRFIHRSLMWFLIKFAIRTSLQWSDFGPIQYKAFLLHFMCDLAMDAVTTNLPSHLLHAISCKILRRLQKLDSFAPQWLHDMILRTNISLRGILKSRWEATLVVQPLHPLWKPSQLDLDADTHLSLHGSGEYIRHTIQNYPSKSHHFPLRFQHILRGTLNDFLSGSFFEEAYRFDPFLALYDFELAVEKEIDDWLACVMDVNHACIQVEATMDKYLSSAKGSYRGNLENISIMLLTALELWVVLDKLVVGVIPMLSAYSPEIPRELLHIPLLFKATHLQRLSRAYRYLSDRHSCAYSAQSVFSAECSGTTFLHDVNYLYDDDSYLSLAVEYAPPVSPNMAVFQLQCTIHSYLHIWSFATACLLKSFPSHHAISRVYGTISHLASWTSPVTNNVYFIFSSNALAVQGSGKKARDISRVQWFYYWRMIADDKLDEYINGTSHTPNGVLAAQAECPEGISLQEFISFGHLRSGGSLQWFNILQQLRSETINFRHHKVYFLFAAAVSQVGPFDPSTSELAWHQELQELSFCRILLDDVERLLMKVAVHSLDSTMMSIISLLLTRLLASSSNEEVTECAIGLLQRVRRIVFDWMQDLSYDLMTAPLNTKRREVLRNLAATCRSTFAVGPDAIHKLVCSAEDIGALLFCAITIRANSSIDSHSGYPESYSGLLLERDRRLSFDLQNVVRNAIEADPSNRGVDLAVRGIWPGFRPGPRVWQVLPHPNSQWLACETAAVKNTLSQTVHLNLLDGTLLVDGRSMDGLPEVIRKQPTYKQIFGDQCFLVVPSNLPGIDLCSLGMICDHQVYFGLRGYDVVIRVQHKDATEILEVIPAEKLQGDLPRKYVDNHVHWLNLSTSIIEIRPYETLWEESSENWRVDCRAGRFRMYKGHEWLINVASPSYDMVSSRLKCLDYRENLVIATLPINDAPESPEARQLSAVLSRYSLSFFINGEEELESHEFRDMVYDEDQCIGTLFGLENRLVLRPSIRTRDFIHRCIVVPVGRLQAVQQSHHHHHPYFRLDSISTLNSIEIPTQPVRYHTYFVDTDLGCLTSNDPWKSMPYLAYLHANTSINWMPDPLTGKTGVQEAHCILRSAECQSIVPEVGTCNVHEFVSSVDYKIYPQLELAIQEIKLRIYRHESLRGLSHSHSGPRALIETDTLRTAYLFPFEGVTKVPWTHIPRWRKAREDVRSVSRAVYHWIARVGYGREESQGHAGVMDKPWVNLKHLLGPYIAEVDAFLWNHQIVGSFLDSMTWIELADNISTLLPTILQQSMEARQRFRLLFLLPTTVYFFENISSFIHRAIQRQFHSPLYLPGPLDEVRPSVWHFSRANPSSRAHYQLVTLEQLFQDRSAPNLPAMGQLQYDDLQVSGNRIFTNSHPTGSSTLSRLFSSFQMNETDPAFQKLYLTRLHDSAWYAQREASRMPHQQAGRPSMEALWEHYLTCKENYVTAFISLRTELGPLDDPLGLALHQSGQWPPITPHVLLRCLASTSIIPLPDEWRKCLLSFALLLVQLQRSRRLLQLAMDNHEEEFFRELENNGCDGWDVENYPDWLLTQIQGNLIIRETQADAAMKLISPPSGENTLMQVNMGEGKSSVILPISAATLADGYRLVRVIVPKSLTVQMIQLLTRRLGGLLNRPIYHLPFSRSYLKSDFCESQCQDLQIFLFDCVREHGILVVQPEHVLSLNLSIVEQLLPQKASIRTAETMNLVKDRFLKLQKWVSARARDILDESDDILHPRFQLAYTIGPQQHIEGSPDRWTTIQQLLRLVRKHVLSLSFSLPDTIEYERSTSGSFPRIRILRASDTSRRLISLIVDDVMNGHLHSLQFRGADRDRQILAAIRAFISHKNVPHSKANIAESYGRQTNIWDSLLLLRGLLACNLLVFSLSERRWRIDYGLSPKRTMLAVPYRAKDVPARRAEFGHPDITLLLTCLSYYYGGLTEEQLRTSFKILQEQDDPSKEYANWLQDYDLDSVPQPIQDLDNVKIQPSEQWDTYIFPLFTRNQRAVDFYLSRVVFPKEAKEFSQKLIASSWDLAEIREQLITGFSGTNDGQYLLPSSITQHNLDHQRGCNAKILLQLLQPENNSYILISHPNGKRQTSLELLRTVVKQEPEVSVLLDVGAQILDFSNYQLAKTWLKLTFDSDGAIYFNESDELMVLTRDGVCRPLVSSALAQRLDRCVVYLDDAHTRGTDLKLPRGTRAAVTLGPKVTKDRLVQGCMRMRKLGNGHSVMFLAPLEVDRSIRAIAAKEDQNVPITTTDILQWAINETWTDIQKWAPYWAQQGISHKSRYDALSRFCNGCLTSEELEHAWIQPERKSLADLYAPFQSQTTPIYSSALDDYPDIQQGCEDLGILQFPGTQVEEEQEREVNREMEREQETQSRPLKGTPVTHVLHPDIITFVRTGVIPAHYSGSPFQSISTALRGSTAAVSEARFWSPFLLATLDFCSTVTSVSHQDLYLRPVQWILSGNWEVHRILVILSPFEADSLMPYIRDSNYVHLHVYAPRTFERMKSSDDLMFYSIPSVPDNWTPPWDLIDQLNIFAGQLYFRDYESYRRSCVFLGIHDQDLPRSIRMAMQRNRITPDVLQDIENTCTNSPLKSVINLLLIRRGGLSFGETHMGRILQGQRLTESDFGSLPVPKAISNYTSAAYDTKTYISVTTDGGHASSSRSQSSKRGSDAVRSSDADLSSLQKRSRAK